MNVFEKILVANRGEIAIRVLRAANEMGKATVAVFSDEDRLSLHRSKADESYRIGDGMGPVGAYLSVKEMLRVVAETGADAIHPGYGFLSESPDFAQACASRGIAFIGPRPRRCEDWGTRCPRAPLRPRPGCRRCRPPGRCPRTPRQRSSL